MSWLLPKAIPTGGTIRSVGEYNRTAYDRAYYHAKRKPRKQTYTADQKKRRADQYMARYWADPEHFRALGRAAYWRRKTRQGKR